MKKRLLGFTLALLMLIPLLSSCQHENLPPVVPAKIYTLYTIADATPESIRQVELALNRVLFYRVGYILDIVAVTEDEYNDLIAKQFDTMAAYEAEQKNKKKDKKSTSSEAASETSEIMTGEKIIEKLENNEDIPSDPSKPSFDIFLVRGYDEYFKLANEGKLTAIQDKLTSEAKLLKDYIHTTFFTAATINKKVFGVPVNDTIGDYKYAVFDAELLTKYGYDAATMKNLSDLEGYLALIKANEPDVVPLKNATDSADFSYMFSDGFASYVNTLGEVKSSYEDKDLLSYYGMITRYNSLGYFSNAAGNSDGRFAVTFITGDESDISDLTKETGYEYKYNIYQKPLATNRNTIKNIYCLSKYCIADDIKSAMEILTELFTDPKLQNILTYGIENTHYTLDDNGQVVRKTSDYIINPDYTGNKFITYTLEGDDPQKWEKAKKHNLDSTPSKILGYDFIPTVFEYTDEEENKLTLSEPDYITIIKNVIDKYYPSIMNGTIVKVDIEALKAEAAVTVRATMQEALKVTYEAKIQQDYSAQQEASIRSGAMAKTLYAQAEESIKSKIITKVKSNVKAKLTDQVKTELGPDATADEILAKVDELLTDEYIWENRNYNNEPEEDYDYNDANVKDLVDSEYTNTISLEVNKRLENYLASGAYTSAINSAINSAAFKNELDKLFAKNSEKEISDLVDKNIATLISAETDKMIEEFNTELEAAVTAFVSDNTEKLKLSSDEILAKIGYLVDASKATGDESGADTSGADTSGATSSAAESSAATSSAAESSAADTSASEESGDKQITYKEAYKSYFEFVLKEKIEKQYYAVYPIKENAQA